MWQEMRKHEKKLRGMIVDYKRRSERRKEYYERIKRDPAEFLQIWGRPAKIHLDPAIATAAEATLTPWRDDETTLIDRFDVRSHLDIIDEYALKHQQNQQGSESLSEAEQNEERLCNYERYRVLIHNESTGVNEEQCLRDIEFDEKFGALRDDHHPASREAKKKKSTTKKAEIGFIYDDAPITTSSRRTTTVDDSDDDDDDDDLDIEIDISQLTSENKASLNKVATHYGMAFGDFARMLILDREEMQTIRENKLEREQDIPVKGRRARRERRLAKERRIKERDYCPPNYLSREIPKLPAVKAKSRSRSPSPVDTTPVKEKIEFITAFGDDDASKNDLKRKRPFEKSLLDECREAKKKAEPTVIPIRTRRLVTPPRLPVPTTSFIPCRSVQRKSQVLLSTLQKLKEDSSPERRALSDDEIPAIKIVRLEKKDEKEENNDDEDEDDDDEEKEDDDLQQYLKRKEARQRNEHSITTPSNHKKNDSNESTTIKNSSTKTPQEKLRRRMQSLLKKQFQKDKDQQRERQEREEREREARESELRQSSAKLRHHRSRHHSSSRSRSRSRSRSPSSRRRHHRSSSRSSSSSSSSSSRHSSNNRNKKRSSPVKSHSPTPEFLRQRFRRDRHRRSSSSSSSSSSRSDRSSSKRKRTDYK